MPNEQLRRDEVCEITSSRDRNYWLCTGSVYDLCYKITCDFTVYNNPVNSIRRACEQSRWSVAAGGGVQGGPHGGEGVSGDPAEAGGMRRKPSGGRGIEEGSVGARPGNTAVEGHAGSSVRTLSPRVLHGEGRSGRPRWDSSRRWGRSTYQSHVTGGDAFEGGKDGGRDICGASAPRCHAARFPVQLHLR